MADNIQQNIILSVRTDTSQAQEGVQQLGTQLNRLGKTDVGTGSVQSLKAAIREANAEAQIALRTYGATSQEFVESAKRVAELKKQFHEYTQTIQAFNPANKLAALTGVARGATGAIEGVAGAMAFLGGESSKNEEIIRRLHGLMLFADSLEKIDAIKNSFKNLGLLLGITTKAQTALNTSQEAGAVATGTQTVAMEGQTVATEGATVATEGLGVALKAIGIGLIIAAVVLLITQWDNLKSGLGKLISPINNAADGFDRIKGGINGVWTVLKNLVVGIGEFVADIFSGNFSKAVKELKDSVDFSKSFNEGFQESMLASAKEHAKDQLNVQVETLKRQIEVAKAGGKDTYALEKQLATDKLNIAKQNAEDILKTGKGLSEKEISELNESDKKKYNDYLDAKKDIEIADAEHGKKMDEERKKRNEKLKEERNKAQEEAKRKQSEYDTLTNQLTEYYRKLEDIEAKESEKLNEKTSSERESEINKSKEDTDAKLRMLEDDYQKEKAKQDEALQNKRLSQSDYNDILKDMAGENAKAINLITEVEKKSELDINKKYNDKVVEYLAEVNAKQLSIYEEKRVEIRKKTAEISKDANEIDKALLKLAEAKQIADIDTKEEYHKNTVNSQTNVVVTQNENRPDANDNPDEKLKKLEKNLAAERMAEANSYAEKRKMAEGNADEIAKIDADHHKAIMDFNTMDLNWQKMTDEEKAKSAENSLNQIADLVGKNTVAGKAMSIASATISTFEGAAAALKHGPIGIAEAAIVVAAGLASVKKIIDTKIPGQSDAASPSISAPTLDSAHLQPQAQTQNVNVVNQSQRPIQATITQKELQDNEARTSFVNNLRSF